MSSKTLRNFMERNTLAKQDKHTATSTSTAVRTTQLPGIDNSQVIISYPNFIKENGKKVSHDPKDIPTKSGNR